MNSPVIAKLANIPEELKSHGRFCLVNSGDKAPYKCNGLESIKARPNEPKDFSNYQTAINALQESTLIGTSSFYTIGLYAYNGFGFLDFDHCIDKNGNLEPRVKKAIEYFNSYTEYSTSGTGIHIYIKCSKFLEKYNKAEYERHYKFRSSNVECYLSGLTFRYGIMTGNQYPTTPNIIADVSDKIEPFLNKYLSKSEIQKPKIKTALSCDSDDQMIEWLSFKSHYCFEFNDLFNSGNISNYPSASEADLTLASLISFRCGNNPEQIKRIMWRSALARKKWTKHKTYLDRTIQRAIDGHNGNFYDKNYYLKESVSIEPKQEQVKSLNYLTGSQTEIKPVEWLWHPYIPKGAVTLLSSSPGAGKTYLATWITAQITSGRGFPDNNDLNNIGNQRVVYLSLEDDYNRTIIPRLIANGGNTDNFYYLSNDEMPESFSDPKIARILMDLKPDLIIFDALSSFIGNTNVNHFNDVRRALSPLLRTIEESNTAVLLIAHNNKMSSVTNAMERVSGSVDFTAFIRSGLSLGKNPKNEEEIIMAQFKNNLYNLGGSLAFEFNYPEDQMEIPAFEYKGISELSADELLGGSKRPSPKLDQAKKVLTKLMDENGGTAKAKEIKEQLHKMGFADKTINKAKNALGIKHKTFRKDKVNTTIWSLEGEFK